ncbi:MAG TPA: hypothetical protein VGX28_10830 [Frankiaceae bacterium]|nr:hypothetical protein [Frankiaceae bacterium]
MTQQTVLPDPGATTLPAEDEARGAGVVALGLVVAAAAHVPSTGHHLAEAPYMGAAFVGFTLACVVLLLALSSRVSRAALLASASLCAAAVGAYVATRLVAMPGLAHDVGAWWEPWGVVAIAAETVVAFTATRMVAAS